MREEFLLRLHLVLEVSPTRKPCCARISLTIYSCVTIRSYFIGKRRGYGTERILYKPHNVGHVILGTILLAVGWLGFKCVPPCEPVDIS